ncbi:MAG: glycoside hydrolase family 97 protein [Muribaculaceae bacterium]|nr:glycoside hydrolase family 97 protein [Muribaculaceae bacterium]
MAILKVVGRFSILLLSSLSITGASAISSPNGKINIEKIAKGIKICYERQPIMVYECGEIENIVDIGRAEIGYEMLIGKRSRCHNAFTDVDVYLRDGKKVDIRVYDDGVAWKSDDASKIDLKTSTHNWIQQWVQPYEEFFPLDRVLSPGSRWAFPALFEFPDSIFMLLTESDINRDGVGASIYSTDSSLVFEVKAPDEGENGWVTAIIGTLGDVVESTLVTDNSEPCQIQDTSWIAPGVASWVYWAYNHGSKEYDIVKKYIDMAIKLKLPYVLIDAEWDEMHGDGTVVDLLNYANKNGVKPMLWYNSSIGWIDGAPGPKFRLNEPQKREQEFAWCEANGVKGVKIDFFSGDNNQNMKYMIELLECAARHHLLVNFHGATLPRGWQRTYPNMISTEGVYGAEWYNNVPTFTKLAASHNATLPFTRNVVGPMDYTPCAFSDSQHPHITSNAHELALTALFESGIQHIADSPESLFDQPVEVLDFISGLPSAWDDTYFICGYPGDFCVIAREKDGYFYIAGINGNDSVCIVDLDYSSVPFDRSGLNAIMFADGEDSEWNIKQITELPDSIAMKPRGGFVIKVFK